MDRFCIYLRRDVEQEVDTLERIAELRSVLLATRSEDLRLTIQAAIEDCEQRLAELQSQGSDPWPASAT